MSEAGSGTAAGLAEIKRPTLMQILLACAKVSISTFGGGVSAVMRVEFVVLRRWIGEAEFLEGLALSQALPGVNVINLSLWIGYSLRGTPGALVAMLGSVLPPAVILVAAGSFIHEAAANPLVAKILAGIAAAALGFTLALGARAARHALVDPATALVFVATMAAALFHVPVVAIVGCLAPVSVFLAYRKVRNGQG